MSFVLTNCIIILLFQNALDIAEFETSVISQQVPALKQLIKDVTDQYKVCTDDSFNLKQIVEVSKNESVQQAKELTEKLENVVAENQLLQKQVTELELQVKDVSGRINDFEEDVAKLKAELANKSEHMEFDRGPEHVKNLV